jgi:hypothetical protein
MNGYGYCNKLATLFIMRDGSRRENRCVCRVIYRMARNRLTRNLLSKLFLGIVQLSIFKLPNFSTAQISKQFLKTPRHQQPQLQIDFFTQHQKPHKKTSSIKLQDRNQFD